MHILVLSDVNTTKGGTLYEASRVLCDCLARDHGAWVTIQPYCLPMRSDAENRILDAARVIANRCDGYVSLGGIFDLPHDYYASGKRPDVPDGVEWTPEKHRFNTDNALVKAFLDADKPLLTICGGMQVLAGVLGCKMGLVDGHWEPSSPHEINIQQGSLLNLAVQTTKLDICTWHREHVVEVSDQVTVSARASDGVIEAIEARGARFAIGVQGHPEFHLKDPESPWHLLLRSFVSATRQKMSLG